MRRITVVNLRVDPILVIAVCVSGVVLLDLATFNSDYPIFNRNIHDPDPNGMLLLTLVLPLLMVSLLLWFVGKRRGS
jgi:hypothetical protein